MKRQALSAIIALPLVAAGLLVLPSCKPAPSAPPATPAATPASKPVASPVAPAASAPAAPAAQAAPPAPSVSVTAPTPAGPAIELKDPVATVDGVAITKAQLDDAFKAAVESAGAKAADLTPEQKLNGYRQLLDELIMDKLVAKAAAGITVSDEEVNAEIAKIKKQFPDEQAFAAQLKEAGQTPEKLSTSLRTMLQQQRWMKSQIKDLPVTDEDAKKFYDGNPTDFQNPDTVKASHILFLVNKDDSEEVVKQKQAAAQKAADRAKKGEDFTKLAKELSEEPGAKESGGDLGFFSKDRMVPEFAEVAFKQNPGEISAPVRTQFGWHVIKVTEKKPAGTVPFEQVKEQITSYLKGTKQREAVQTVLKGLKDSSKIENTLPPAAAAKTTPPAPSVSVPPPADPMVPAPATPPSK